MGERLKTRRLVEVSKTDRTVTVGHRTGTAVEQCGNCRFFRRRTDHAGSSGGGYCVRFPPSFRIADTLNDGWPNVHQQRWCGEYQSPLLRAKQAMER